jgi:hypothetical protein
MSLDDKNALYRLQTLLSTFEYMTTNASGSHIAYAAYFGAKVHIYGSYCRYREEDFRDDPFYLANPEVLNVALNLLCKRTVYQHLKDFFVLPQEAMVRKDWGEYQVGLQHKKKPSEMLGILFSGKAKSFSHWSVI